MNKTKMFTIALMAFCVVGLATAGLVGRISNASEYSDYSELSIYVSNFTSDDESTWYAGETKVISGTLENLANEQIKGKLKVVISNDGISLNDFETLTASIVEYVDGVEVFSVSDVDMTVVGGFIESIDTTIPNQLTFITTERTFEVGETWDADITRTMKLDAVGEYNIAVTTIPL